MEDIRVSTAGEHSIPKPFNENDVTVWNALICKFVCEKNYFNKSDFITEVINDKIIPVGAYNKKRIRDSISDDKNEFSQLITYCLIYLTSNKLLKIIAQNSDSSKYDKYSSTPRLKSMCPEIKKVIMPGIKSVLDAEKEIRQDKNYKKIVMLLKHLVQKKEIPKSDVLCILPIDTLYKLVQFSIIILYLNDTVAISGLGTLLYPLLKDNKKI